MGNVRFKVGEHTVIAELIEERINISRHTGKGLFQLDVQFKAHAAQRQSIQGALSEKGTLLSADGDAFKDKTVLLFEKQYSYTDGQPLRNHIWTLTEEEVLKIDSLQVADISLEPYWFIERFDGDALIITARVEVNASTEKVLRSLPRYFPVIRRGISDEPRSMRFGQILWSSVDGENYKLCLTIVERIYDEQRKTPALFQPQLEHIMGTLALTDGRLAQLLGILGAKGLLTEEEKTSINEVSDPEKQKRLNQFDRVPDLDLWLDNEEAQDGG